MLWESWIYLEIPRILCDQIPFSWCAGTWMGVHRQIEKQSSSHVRWGFLLKASSRWLRIILFGLFLMYYMWFIWCRLLAGFVCEHLRHLMVLMVPWKLKRVRKLSICISEMTCGCFRKENLPKNILHDNVYYHKRLYIMHYTEVPATQHGSHPNPMHYKIYTLWQYALCKSVL